jgi:HlyD family secretion protein
MPEASERKLDIRWLWVPATLVLILIFFGVRRMTRPELPVRVEPQSNWAASAPAPGTIKQLFVHSGQQVTAGQLLLTMQDADATARLATALTALSAAQANLSAIETGGTQEEQLSLTENTSKAQLDVNDAQKNLATLQQLQSQGAASPSEVENARQTLAAAKLTLQGLQKRKTNRYATSDIDHAKAALADAQSSYRAAQAVVAESNVRAPFAGTVYSLPVSQTEYVQQGQELLQLADLSKLQVRAYFDEPEIGLLQVGQAATITWDAKLGHKWTGRVMRLPSTIINYGTRNVGETLISIDPSDVQLLPNVNVIVTVTTQQIKDTITIPRDALHPEAGKDYVYLVKGDSIKRRAVITGAINFTQVQVLSGLSVGDVVALRTTNGEPLAEGVPIRQIQ